MLTKLFGVRASPQWLGSGRVGLLRKRDRGLPVATPVGLVPRPREGSAQKKTPGVLARRWLRFQQSLPAEALAKAGAES